MTPHSQTSRRDPTFDPVSVTRFVAPIDGGRVIEISSSPMCCRRHCEPESAMMPLRVKKIMKPRRVGQTYAVWPLTNAKIGDVISRTAYPDLALPIWRAEIPSRSKSIAKGLCEHDPCIFA